MEFRGIVKHWSIVFLFTPKWVDGITIFPFIFVRKNLKDELAEKDYNELINHERIHIVQQLECLIFPWLLIYCFNYLVNLIRFREHFEAYYNICMEREAYQNQSQMDYLDKRKTFQWKKYFK